MAEPLYIVTQDDQPYGSVRRCCQGCGAMCWPGKSAPSVHWTDDWAAWLDTADNCCALAQTQREP